MSEMNNKVVASSFIWRFLERFGAKGVEFIVSILLARLLVPETYGIIALVTVFTTILNLFIDSGFGNVLIQKKNADDIDFSTVFIFNVIICIIIYVLIWFLSPYISSFYNMPELCPVIRVLSLTLIISGVKNIQHAYVSRNLLFKKFFFATLAGTVMAGIVGVLMAYQGYGIWALVAQQLVNAFIDTILLWITVKWRPRLVFSIQRLRILYSYGWKLLISSLLDTLYNEIQSLVIGKVYSSSSLAFYNQGKKYPNLLASNINASIDAVLFPVMSMSQDSFKQVKQITRRSIRTSLFILAPIMIGMCATSETIIKLVLTEKWLPAQPYFIIFCISFVFYPVHTANLTAIKAVGRSDLYLRIEIIKKIFAAIVLIITVWFGPLIMALSTIFTTIVSIFINSWPNKRLIDYSYREQATDIVPSVTVSTIMGLIVFGVGFIPFESLLVKLVIQTIVGMILYVALTKITCNDSLEFIISFIKRK